MERFFIILFEEGEKITLTLMDISGMFFLNVLD